MYDCENSEWRLLPDMNYSRINPGIVSANNGKLYAIGGKGSEGTIEVFENNRWNLINDLNVKYFDQEYEVLLLLNR